ncbi:MAG: hypothetical protein M3Q66_01545 [Chloroflexota bacterium]|nr:hypothetical protein [Chloroflexota bacterium]
MLGTRQPPLAAALAAARSVVPAGVEIRAWRELADFAAMVRVFQAARVVDGTGWEVTVASLESDLRGLGLEPTVDTENPSGALGLYERHGFRETDRVIIFRRDLEPAP